MSCSDFAAVRAVRRWPRQRRAILSIVVLFAAGCAQAPEAIEPPPPKVTVQHPEERELVDYDRYNGWTRASETLEVRSRVRGHIKKIHFTDGKPVKKGDLLIELDPRPFLADLEQAKDQLAIDQSQLEFAAADEERNQQLFDKKAVSKAELDKAIASRKTWVSKVEAAKEQIKRAELELEYSRITSDISGRIGRAMLTEGNLVNAGGSDPLLTTVVAIDPIYVYFPVDERSLLKFREGRAAKYLKENEAEKPGSGRTPAAAASSQDGANAPGSKSDSQPEAKPEPEPTKLPEQEEIPFDFGFETEKGYPHKGIIDFADNRIDSETGTVEVRGRAANSDAAYFPGSRVRVQIPISDEYKALVIPDVAILSDQDQRYVLALNDENVVVRRSVEMGRLLPDGMRVVLPSKEKHEGITSKDWVIVLGLQRARINYPVEPVDADGKPIARTAK